MTRLSSERGIALVITLLFVSLLSALALGLLLASSAHRLATANHHYSLTLLNAADAAIAITMRELDAVVDWSEVIDGSRRSALSDAASPGLRTLPGGVAIDVVALGHELSCGRSTPCTPTQVRATTNERPWGDNNPQWQPFLYAPLETILSAAASGPVYVVVWVGDDASEADGDPLIDGGAGGSGRGAVRVLATAFGSAGAQRSIETHVTRVCNIVAGTLVCLPGIHVQSWRIVNASIP